jgi:hypothetical protein
MDYEGRAIVAVVSFAGEDAATIRRFYQGTIQAVAALEKYNPREVSPGAGAELPTDMPPNRDMVAGARYAITGGVYPGNRAGDYYLQLWLWEMGGSTMIYTDDLVYVNIEVALESLPGLVEWLFSHIREVTLETPPPAAADPLLLLGLRAGISPRWYLGSDKTTLDANALAVEGGVSGSLRITSFLAVQAELLLTGDNKVDWVLPRGADGEYFLAYEQYATLFLTLPVMLKMNFRTGPFRLSPLAGFYVFMPLGQARFHESRPGGTERSYSYATLLLAGFAAGFEAALPYGPGMIVTGLRYAGDFSALIINNDEKTGYKRNMVSFFVGYEFGLF